MIHLKLRMQRMVWETAKRFTNLQLIAVKIIPRFPGKEILVTIFQSLLLHMHNPKSIEMLYSLWNVLFVGLTFSAFSLFSLSVFDINIQMLFNLNQYHVCINID